MTTTSTIATVDRREARLVASGPQERRWLARMLTADGLCVEDYSAHPSGPGTHARVVRFAERLQAAGFDARLDRFLWLPTCWRITERSDSRQAAARLAAAIRTFRCGWVLAPDGSSWWPLWSASQLTRIEMLLGDGHTVEEMADAASLLERGRLPKTPAELWSSVGLQEEFAVVGEFEGLAYLRSVLPTGQSVP